MTNTLYYGDNISFLREMGRESVDLIYLDPPFNSDSTYNLLYRTPEGGKVQAQTAAFKDTWTWETSAAAEAFDDVVASGSSAAEILRALKKCLGQSDTMAYLCMMTVRLIEMHRLLKPSGSLYLHCDPTASHYLKVALDGIFRADNFRSEIIWRRSAAHNKLSRQYGPIHDSILFYAKSNETVLHPGATPYSRSYIQKMFRHEDGGGSFRQNEITGPGTRNGESGLPWRGYDPTEHGRHWAIPQSLRPLLPLGGAGMTIQQQLELLHSKGAILISPDGRPTYRQYPGRGVAYQDIWSYQSGTEGTLYGTEVAVDADVKWLDSEAERIGYPTQKPVGLLRRIVESSSEPGALVLDPFCGCGTTIEAAESMGRRWIGIDITHHAIDVIEGRLRKRSAGAQYDVKGRPSDLSDARDLAKRDPYEFQWWANWRVGVQNYRERKKGPDMGIDGIIYFRNGPWGVGQTIVSVKSGENVGSDEVARLAGTVQREEAELGILVCFEPTRRMRQDAAGSGMVQTAQGRFQRIQVVTVQELLDDHMPPMPKPLETEAFKSPLRPNRRVRTPEPEEQLSLKLPFVGRKGKPAEVEDHLAGDLLAQIAQE
jgi:site-specific DNA-methyltransferase (adenine-specific)